MLDSRTRKAIEAKKYLAHVKSFLNVFNPLFILTPLIGRRRCWEFEDGMVEYRDIYVFGFRVIRWQL